MDLESILGLALGCIILSTSININEKSNFNPDDSSFKSVITLKSGGRTESSENNPKIYLLQASEQKLDKREMLRKHFPDWKQRMDFQEKQEKIYYSGLARMIQAKRIGIKYNLNKQEEDAFDYLNGQNFYKEKQSLKTPPNIYDTRSSFLLKMEKNKTMRENFLKAYNRRNSEN